MDFEKEILIAVNTGIQKIISDRISGYNSPFNIMIDSVILSNKETIVSKMDSALKSVISNPEFDIILKEEFNRKVAKILLSSLEGAIEKVANTFKQNPTLKARMILAIQQIIKGE